MLPVSIGQPNLALEFGSHMMEVVAAIVVTVTKSAKAFPVRGNERAEAKRRTTWLKNTALELRHSMHWGHQRIIDNLDDALTSYLQTGSWEPDKRSLWIGSDGN